eukprot:gene52967-43826_t
MDVTDNISAVVAVVGADPGTGPDAECIPGPYTMPWSAHFRGAYTEMAERGGSTLGAALARRYEL